MAVEEQTDVSRGFGSIAAATAWGQKLTISNRVVTHLSFYLKRVGTVTGSVKYWIRAVDDDEVLASKVQGLGSAISTTAAWYEVELDSPLLINEEVYILVGEHNISNSAGNLINIYDANADVKASENMVRRSSAVYSDYPANSDFGYKYTYTIGAAGFIYSQAHIIG